MSNVTQYIDKSAPLPNDPLVAMLAESRGTFLDFLSMRGYIADPFDPSKSFLGDLNDLLNYSSPSTKYVRNANGLLVPGTTLRVDHDVAGSPVGLLVEGQRTNNFVRSEEFNNASWLKSNVTVTANAAIAPDGTMTADKLIASANSNVKRIYQNPTENAAPAVLSVFAKAAEWGFLILYSDARGGGRVFNLSTGESTAAVNNGATSWGSVEYADGWRRYWVQYDTYTTSFRSSYIYTSQTGSTVNVGDGTSGIYIWGCAA